MKEIRILILEAQKENNPEFKLKQLELIDKKLYQIMTAPTTSSDDLEEVGALIQLLRFSSLN